MGMTARCPTPRKVGYHRKSIALLAADKLRIRFDSRPYLCRCGRWHLGSTRARSGQ